MAPPLPPDDRGQEQNEAEIESCRHASRVRLETGQVTYSTRLGDREEEITICFGQEVGVVGGVSTT